MNITTLKKEAREEFTSQVLMSMKVRYGDDEYPNTPGVSWDFIEKDIQNWLPKLIDKVVEAVEVDNAALTILASIVNRGGTHGHIDGEGDPEENVALAYRYAEAFTNFKK